MGEQSFDLQPAAPAEPDFDLQPDSAAQQPASLSAFRAQRAGVDGDRAAQALALSRKTGASPQFVADNLDTVRHTDEQSGFEDALGAAPVTAAYAAQSAVHAAAVKEDVGPLQALEQGLYDLGYQEAATLQMSAPSLGLEGPLETYDQRTAEYDQKHSGVVADLLRAAPSLGLYYLTGAIGKAAGGTLGEVGATGGLMFALNRGTLYRQIMQAMPLPEGDEFEAPDPVAYEQRARAFATVGAGVSATIAAGLSSASSLMFPGAAQRIQGVANGIIIRAFVDPATRDVVGRLASIGGKSLAGALTMAASAMVDDATVQKAASGKIDGARALETGWEAFKKNLLAATVLSAAPHAKGLVEDLGRIASAPAEAEHLSGLVDQANQVKLVERNPHEAEQLIGKMAAQSDTPTVYVDGEAAQDPKVAAKLVEALADDGRAVAEAKATGGDVPVPIEKYLTQIAPTLHDALEADVKLSPDGATPNQAREIARRAEFLGHYNEDITPEDKTQETRPLPELAAEAYGGTPEQWAKALTPEAVEMVKRVVAPEPRPVPQPGTASLDDAREMIDSKTIGEIQPGRYDLAARRAEDKLAQAASAAAERGTEAAREGFMGAGLQAASEGPATGRPSLREAGKKAGQAERQLATVPELQHAKDMARAMAEVARETREEMDKARSYLAKRSAPDADLAKAGPEYSAAASAIASVGSGGQPAPGAIDALLQRMASEGHLVGFDEQALRDSLGKPWEKLTPPEARNVVDAMKNLRRSARMVNEITFADKRQGLRDVVGSISAEASTRKDLGAPAVTRSADEGLADKVSRGAGLFNTANLKPETIFTQLGETAHRLFEEKIIGARDFKNELQGQHLRYFMENFDSQMRGLRGWLREPVKTSLTIPKGVDLDGTKVNRETLAMAFLNLGSASNEQRLTSGYQWDGAQLRQEIGKNIMREKLDFLQGILSYNDKVLWPLVKAHAEKQTGIAPPKVVAQKIRIPLPDGTTWEGEGGYFPAAPNRDALNIPDRGADGVQQIDPAARATVQASFTKLRTKQASYPVDLNWSRYPAHVSSVFHYLAYDEPVRDMGKLLRDQEFQYTARHFVGDDKLQQLREDNKVWARGSVGDASGVLSFIDQMAAKVLRSRAVSNALAFSTPIALGQESHIQYAVTSGQISAKNATAAMARQLPWTDTWVATRAVSDEVRLRSDRYADQFREAISGSPARTMLGHGVDRAAFAQMEAADAILSHVIFDAAMNDALEAKMSTEDAVREGNRQVRLLMPSHNPLEMAPIVRSRGTVGALMLFRGLPNVVWNVESGLYDEARQQVGGASGARQLAAAGGRVALNTARMVGSVAVLHMLGRLLMGHGKKPEDGEGMAGWGTWAEREALAAQFSRIPLGRDVAEPIIDAYQHDKPIAKAVEDIRIAPDLAVVQGIVKDLGKIGSDSTADEDRVQAAVSTVMTLLGGGARSVVRAARYAWDAMQGNVDVRGPGDVIGGAVYGQHPNQEKNIPVAIQDAISGE